MSETKAVAEMYDTDRDGLVMIVDTNYHEGDESHLRVTIQEMIGGCGGFEGKENAHLVGRARRLARKAVPNAKSTRRLRVAMHGGVGYITFVVENEVI